MKSEIEKRTARVLRLLIDAVTCGAREVLAVRQAGSLAVTYKENKEMVTDADRRSDAAMRAILEEGIATKLETTIPIALLLEESGSTGMPSRNWIGADPLDGTAHFATGGSYYSIQAHYVEGEIAKVGVVFQPEVYLPLMESRHCLGRMAYAIRGIGAFYQRTELTTGSFELGPTRRIRRRPTLDTGTYVACVPLSPKMSCEDRSRALKALEGGIVTATTGTGGAGGNIMLTIFGGQEVYANFGAGNDLDLIPPQVIAEECGMTVWGSDRRPPVWNIRSQPVVVAPTEAIADRFLRAAGL